MGYVFSYMSYDIRCSKVGFYDGEENLCFHTINIINFLTDKNAYYTFD